MVVTAGEEGRGGWCRRRRRTAVHKAARDKPQGNLPLVVAELMTRPRLRGRDRRRILDGGENRETVGGGGGRRAQRRLQRWQAAAAMGIGRRLIALCVLSRVNKLLNKLSQILLCTIWIDKGLFDCRV